MAEAVTIQFFFNAFVALGIISVFCILYTFFVSLEEFKRSLRVMLLSAVLIASGIVVHTYAFLQYGKDTSELVEFVLGHILIMAGILALVWWSREMEKVSKRLGFGE